MAPSLSLFFLLFILLLCFMLPVTSNYLVFLKLYFLQVLSILLVFFINHGDTLSHDTILLISFILAILIRAFLIPVMMTNFLQRGGFQLVERKMMFGTLITMILMILGILCSYMLTLQIFGQLNLLFMTSLVVLFSGFLVLINHRKIIGDVLGFLLLENALFLIAFALIPAITISIELGILIDILMSLTVFVIAIVKIRQVHGSMDRAKLSQLTD